MPVPTEQRRWPAGKSKMFEDFFTMRRCLILAAWLSAAIISADAAPVRVPHDPESYGNSGIVLRIRDPQGIQRGGPAVGLELEAEQIDKRRLDVPDSDLAHSLEAQFFSLNAVLAVTSWMDWYVHGGLINRLRLDSEETFGSSTLKYGNSPVYGAGMTIAFFRAAPGWQVFGDLRARTVVDPEIEWITFRPPVYAFGQTTVVSSNQRSFRFDEWQASVGLSKAFEFFDDGQPLLLLISGGGVYSDVRVRARGELLFRTEVSYAAADWLVDYDYGNASTKHRVGGFFGVSVQQPEQKRARGLRSTCAQVQLRFIDELAMSLRAGFLF
ncbi:MAG: hypothetical protein NC924_03680 [Candidatus Omnitrophica bacterium]|nr:hypothetical protein [Candidatus Omnitrophota bacterium]